MVGFDDFADASEGQSHQDKTEIDELQDILEQR